MTVIVVGLWLTHFRGVWDADGSEDFQQIGWSSVKALTNDVACGSRQLFSRSRPSENVRWIVATPLYAVPSAEKIS